VEDGSAGGWIFDHDLNSGGYYRDTDQPLVTNGISTFLDKPLGNPGDRNVKYEVVLVSGNGACNSAISAMKPDSDNVYYTQQLPGTCSIVDSVDVYVTMSSS
jgi:hypothetical protein